MMNILINHCWCSDSIWGGLYDCRVILSIDRISKGKTYYDPPTTDWVNLVNEIDLEWKQFGDPHRTLQLKPEPLAWLHNNVKDREGYEHPKGWSIGTDAYNAKDPLSLQIFFERPKDALNFIKVWSCYKKPIHYLNYFQDIRREFDFKTNKLKRVPR